MDHTITITLLVYSMKNKLRVWINNEARSVMQCLLNYLHYIIPITLFGFGLIRFYLLKATATSLIWWTLLFVLIHIAIKAITQNKARMTIELLGIITVFFAGLLTLQQYQPIFSPIIKEEKNISFYHENWILWPRTAGSENMIEQSFEVTDNDISILIPLFPIYNKLPINAISYEYLSANDENEDGDENPTRDIWPKARTYYKIKTGPIRFDKSIITYSDGFTWREAILNKKIYKQIKYLDSIDIVILKYGKLAWENLSREDLEYFSNRYFNNKISLYKYLNNRSYKASSLYVIEKIDKDVIIPKSIDPDFYVLEHCEIVIKNKTDQKQIIRFINQGMYPRDYFVKKQTLFDKARSWKFDDEQGNTANLKELDNGSVTIQAKEIKKLYLLRVQSRNSFESILKFNKLGYKTTDHG